MADVECIWSWAIADVLGVHQSQWRGMSVLLVVPDLVDSQDRLVAMVECVFRMGFKAVALQQAYSFIIIICSMIGWWII